MTDELIDAVLAVASVNAGIGGAFVDVTQTPGVVIASRTVALETVDQIDTDAAVGARLRSAFVDVLFAVKTGESGETFAAVPVIAMKNNA